MKTHIGYSSGKVISPMTAAATTNIGLRVVLHRSGSQHDSVRLVIKNTAIMREATSSYASQKRRPSMWIHTVQEQWPSSRPYLQWYADSARLCTFFYVTDRMQDVIQVTTWSFSKVWRHKLMFKTMISQEMALHSSQDSRSQLYESNAEDV
jgi:hypothetical protein